MNRGNDVVTVFPEVTRFDEDGNLLTGPSAVGTVCRAVIQPLSFPAETQDMAYTTEERLRLRLIGWEGDELGAQSAVTWEGRRYAIDGEPRRYRGSRRTSRTEYVLVRR